MFRALGEFAGVSGNGSIYEFTQSLTKQFLWGCNKTTSMLYVFWGYDFSDVREWSFGDR